jgi:hypothetical protein
VKIKTTNRNNDSWQRRIEVNGFVISIVAGGGLYSTPRRFLDTLDDYIAVEIGVWFANDNGAFENWVSGRRDNVPTLCKYYEDWTSGDDVAAYRSWEDVYRLVADLSRVKRSSPKCKKCGGLVDEQGHCDKCLRKAEAAFYGSPSMNPRPGPRSKP